MSELVIRVVLIVVEALRVFPPSLLRIKRRYMPLPDMNRCGIHDLVDQKGGAASVASGRSPRLRQIDPTGKSFVLKNRIAFRFVKSLLQNILLFRNGKSL